jgi:hypothetical protein
MGNGHNLAMASPPMSGQSNGMGRGSNTQSNGMGNGHGGAMAMPPPPPPVATPDSNGMGSGHHPSVVTCHIVKVSRAERSFVCRMRHRNLKFYLTGRSAGAGHLRIGQDVRVRYFHGSVRTVRSVTVLR